jgi:proline iminopeptidase
MARVRRVVTPGRRSFEYVSQGKGPATLLVHPGGPGLTYHYLRTLLKLSNAHLRVILFNPRGVGKSWKPRSASDYTIPKMAEDIEAIRKALKIKELHLLGFSAGGLVALEYARRHEKNLSSLLMCGTAGSGEEIAQSNRMVLGTASPKQRKRLKELTAARAFDTPEYQKLAEEIFQPFQTRFYDGVHPDWKRTKASRDVYRAMMTRTGDEFRLDGTIARWDGRKYYSKIDLPVLVLVGRYDFLLNPSVEMDQRIEPAHLRVLSRSSHMAIWEQPKEFLGAIREFLNDVTGD